LRCKSKRRKRYGSYECRGIIKNRKSIEERPAIVDSKERIGDWPARHLLAGGEADIRQLAEKSS